jgi:hypothetical protein
MCFYSRLDCFLNPPVRDSTSIETLKRQLERSRSVTIVGNGGIALELIYALCCQSAHHIQHVHWVLKDNHIGSAFFDEAAAAFLMPDFFPDRDPDLMCGSSTLPALSSNTVRSNQGVGGSLGPFWLGHVSDAIGPHRHIVNFNPAPSVVVPDISSAPTVTKPQLTLHLNSSIHCLSQVSANCFEIAVSHWNVIKVACCSGRRFMQGSIDGRDRLSLRLCRSSHRSSTLSSILWPRSKFYVEINFLTC